MRRILATILLLGIVPLGKADQAITNNAGRVYRVREITRIEPDGITVAHAGGIAKLFFWELPEDLQRQHGYDPEAAAQFNAQARAAQTAAAQARREANIQHQQRTAEETASQHQERQARNQAQASAKAAKKETLQGIVFKVVDDGIVLTRVRFKRDKPANWAQVNATYASTGFAPPFPRGDYYVPFGNHVFIFAATDGRYEGERISGTYAEAGTKTHYDRTLKAYR